MALPQSLDPISNAVHLSIDMQNLFAPGGIWETPWMERVLPNIVGIAELNPPRTVFTRFITPQRAEDRPGRWQRYFNSGTARPVLACHPHSWKSYHPYLA